MILILYWCYRVNRHFWPPPQDAKWSELEEKRHNHLLNAVLHDERTQISEYSRYEFILSDREGSEALLFRPRSMIIRIGMRLFGAVLDLFPISESD